MDPKPTTIRPPLKFGISGDCHFRDSQYARASRGRDYFDAKIRLVDAAAGKGLPLLLDTGDFFNSSRPSAAVIQMATKLDRYLRNARIAMLTVTGNHDWSTPTWLDTLFPEAEPSDFGIIPMDDRRVEVGGYLFQGVRPYSVSGYRANEEGVKGMCDGADVVIMHATVNGIVECGVDPERMLDVSELPYVPGLKMIGLGDLHYFGFINHRDCLVGYPGSTEMNSSSEPINKVLPIVELTDDAATITETVPLPVRPFITATVRTTEEADALVAQVTAVAADHPVVVAKFSRDIPEVLARTYAALDPQRAVIRFEPLPSKEETNKDRVKAEDIEAHGIEYFLHARFGGADKKSELALSIDLLARGETDAANILAAYVEQRQKELDVREGELVDA